MTPKQRRKSQLLRLLETLTEGPLGEGDLTVKFHEIVYEKAIAEGLIRHDTDGLYTITDAGLRLTRRPWWEPEDDHAQ